MFELFGWLFKNLVYTPQLNLLKAVARGENKFTGTMVMDTYHLGTPRNVSKNKEILINTLSHIEGDISKSR